MPTLPKKRNDEPVIILEHVTSYTNFTLTCPIKMNKHKATLHLPPSFNIEDLTSQVEVSIHFDVPEAYPKSPCFQWCLCCPPKRWCCSHLGRCHVWWRHNAKRTGDSERLVRWHKRKKKGWDDGKPVPSCCEWKGAKVRRCLDRFRYFCSPAGLAGGMWKSRFGGHDETIH